MQPKENVMNDYFEIYKQNYAKKTVKSQALYEDAVKHLPGGVSTNVRSLIKPYPFFVDRGEGSKLWDVDGNKYIDYNCCYGGIIAGHANPVINEAIKKQMDKGILLGVPSEQDALLVKELKCRYPMMEMFRFTNSGGQSTMYAIKMARAYTGKNKIIKMEGGYHGSHDYALVSHHPPVGQMGPAWAPTSWPLSTGVPEGVLQDIIVAPYNDAEILDQIMKKYEGEIAGVIMEPVIGNCGLLVPEEGYLKDVRAITRKHNACLIIDEVKTGYRLAPGGATELFDIEPDIVCLAKIIGGGMPLGAFGMSKEVSKAILPHGGACHFGTYNGHPGSVAAGLAIAKILDDKAYFYINDLSDYFRKGMGEIHERLGVDALIQGVGSMTAVLFTKLKKVRNYREAIKSDTEFFMKYYMGCLSRGIFLMGPLWSEPSTIGLSHTKEDVDEALNVIEDTLKELTG
jgi:glutamate-1-semialdehyde 2,1-aminomutase